MAASADSSPKIEHWLSYGDEKIPFLVAENHKLHDRIRVHVDSNGSVRVEKPADIDFSVFRDALSKRARWIARRRAEIAETKKHVLAKEYVSGETFFYLGRRHQLKVVTSNERRSHVRLYRGKIEVWLPLADPAAIKRRLSAWYKSRALAYYERRLKVICTAVPWIDIVPEVRLLNMQKQWGNCSPAGKLTLSPALIKAPRDCIDFVLKHELCHIIEHNHSAQFYARLTQLAPRWQEQEAELDGLSELLLTE